MGTCAYDSLSAEPTVYAKKRRNKVEEKVGGFKIPSSNNAPSFEAEVEERGLLESRPKTAGRKRRLERKEGALEWGEVGRLLLERSLGRTGGLKKCHCKATHTP